MIPCVALLASASLFFAGPLVPTASGQGIVELTPELDARAAVLYANIMCPVCDGQTISQSNAQIAITMRQMVREQLVAGQSDNEIYDAMTTAFGRSILASPPTEGIGLVVWTIPPLALIAGAFVVALAISHLKRRTIQTASSPSLASMGDAPQQGIEGFLPLVDQELGPDDIGTHR